MLGKVGGIFKSGCDRQCTFSIGKCFPNDIIIFLNLMPQEVVVRHPVHPSVLKLMKPCMVGMFWKPHLWSIIRSKLTNNHCEVHCILEKWFPLKSEQVHSL